MVKHLWRGLLAGVALLPFLSGCGSGDSPPFSLSCTVQPLPTGQLRAAVTVTNNTSSAANAMIYGPVMTQVRHFYPFTLQASQVVVEQTHGQNTFDGFVVPRVLPNTPSHLLLRFDRPLHPGSIAVATTRTVDGTNGNPLDNPDCVIGKRSQ